MLSCASVSFEHLLMGCFGAFLASRSLEVAFTFQSPQIASIIVEAVQTIAPPHPFRPQNVSKIPRTFTLVYFKNKMVFLGSHRISDLGGDLAVGSRLHHAHGRPRASPCGPGK
jgi:hypothetical protein